MKRILGLLLLVSVLSGCSTAPEKISAPTNLTSTTSDNGVVFITWDVVPGAETYGTYVFFERLSFVPPIPMWEVDEPEIRLTMSEGNYTLYVTAKRGSVESEYSLPVYIDVP